jgi:hypothetical protein
MQAGNQFTTTECFFTSHKKIYGEKKRATAFKQSLKPDGNCAREESHGQFILSHWCCVSIENKVRTTLDKASWSCDNHCIPS